MKKSKQYNFVIPLIIYPFDVMVSLNEDDDKFSRSIVKKYGSEILTDFNRHEKPTNEGTAYTCTSEISHCSIIRVKKFDINSAYSIGTLAHETFHVCEFVLRLCGIILNTNSHEAYAYLIGYLTEQIYKNIK